MKPRVCFAATAILLSCGLEGLASAQEPAGVVITPRFYVGLQIPYEAIGGDFDGVSGLVSPSDAIVLPDIDSATGLGLLVGISPAPQVDFEASLSNVAHDSEWGGAPFDVTHQTLGFTGRIHFRTDQFVQPHLSAGLGFHRLVVKDGSTDGFAVDDGVFTGLGLDLGAGLGGYVTRNLSIGATLVYHLVRYTHAEGVQTSGTVSPGVDGDGTGVIVRVAYYFP
jgi:hypothetical protein